MEGFMKSATADFMGRKEMGPYVQVYEFAASAGALEGYVYGREKMDTRALPQSADDFQKKKWFQE